MLRRLLILNIVIINLYINLIPLFDSAYQGIRSSIKFSVTELSLLLQSSKRSTNSENGPIEEILEAFSYPGGAFSNISSSSYNYSKTPIEYVACGIYYWCFFDKIIISMKNII